MVETTVETNASGSYRAVVVSGLHLTRGCVAVRAVHHRGAVSDTVVVSRDNVRFRPLVPDSSLSVYEVRVSMSP